MQRPFFSIIIVSFNAGEELMTTLSSVLEQHHESIQVIVKDAGSTDHSITSIKEKYSGKKEYPFLLIEEKDQGIYDGMNRAVKEAKGEYLLFMNCGDYFYDSSVLKKAEELIRKNHQKELTSIYYGNLYQRQQRAFIHSSPVITDFTLYRNVPCHQVCFYHRSLFEERGYDLSYKVRADYEHFLYAVKEKKAKCFFMDQVIASYEGGGFSETKENRMLSEKEHKEITLRYLGRGKCLLYGMIMIATLAPLRTKLAENPKWAARYNQVKSLIYRR